MERHQLIGPAAEMHAQNDRLLALIEEARARQLVNVGVLRIIAIIELKNPSEKLCVSDHVRLMEVIIAEQNSDANAHLILLDFRLIREGTVMCNDLFSFNWLFRKFNCRVMDSKELKISTIRDPTRYTLRTRRPIDFTDKNLTYDLPRENNDIDCAKWILWNDGQDLLFDVDLLSVIFLLNQGFRLRLGGQEYVLELLP